MAWKCRSRMKPNPIAIATTELQCRTGESSAWVLAMKGPDAPWLPHS